MKTGTTFLLLLLTLTIVAAITTSAKRCKKNDSLGKDKKCIKSKRAERNGKTRLGRSKGRKKGRSQSPTAPYWRKGPPKSSEKIERENRKVTFACNIRGTPHPEFTWLRNGKKLAPGLSKKFRIRRHRLTIKPVAIVDTGTYTCVANNSLGSLNFTYSLRILENIRFKSIEVERRPENQTAHVGDTAIFTCSSSDWPEPHVYWTRQTLDSPFIESITRSSNSSDDKHLVLYNVTKEDSGVYTCFIGNTQMHKKLSATLTVIEEGEPLPFDPPCALHVRREILVDHEHGCRSVEPVDLHYCAGSCGRSYYMPVMLTEDSKRAAPFFNQTCKCCFGLMGSISIVELDCSLGQKRMGFYPKFRGCRCQACAMEAELSPSTTTAMPED